MNGRMMISLTLMLTLTLVGVFWSLSNPARAHRLVIAASKVKNAPIAIDDPVWLKNEEFYIPVKGRGTLADQEGIVTTRALYTEDNLYFLFKWKDPTRSVIKHSWKFDGQKWHHLKGNEDRIALIFEITRIDKFATRGCAVTCHSPADVPKKEWKLATRTATEKADLWHWKAARSDPYNYADDAWLTVAGNPTGSYRETGRRKDSGAGGDIKNHTEDKSRPLYMQNPAKKPLAAGFLLLEDSVKISDYSVFKAGDIIPFRLPLKPDGSRSDVIVQSRYIDGGWTVMFQRKLDTGHEDDVLFNPLKKYSFALAVFDDSGGEHSKATMPMTLEFSR